MMTQISKWTGTSSISGKIAIWQLLFSPSRSDTQSQVMSLFSWRFYPLVTGGSSRGCLYVGLWVLTSLGGYLFQRSGCCVKSCLLFILLLVLVLRSRDKHRKVFYARTLQHGEGAGWTRDLSILVVTAPLTTRPHCRLTAYLSFLKTVCVLPGSVWCRTWEHGFSEPTYLRLKWPFLHHSSKKAGNPSSH